MGHRKWLDYYTDYYGAKTTDAEIMGAYGEEPAQIIIEKGDLILHDGEEAEILEVHIGGYSKETEFFVKYVKASRPSVMVVESEIAFKRKKKPSEMADCNCGGWMLELEHHYEWCNKHYWWNFGRRS